MSVVALLVAFAVVWLLAALVATIWLGAFAAFIAGWIVCHVVLAALLLAAVLTKDA